MAYATRIAGSYASKYYDPKKAHEYYMKTRELKGYENRYGGARGDGTSAASGMPVTKISSGSNASNILRGAVSKAMSSVSSGSNGISRIGTVSNGGSGSNGISRIATLSVVSNNKTGSGKKAGEIVRSSYKAGSSGAVVSCNYVARASTGDDKLDELAEKYDRVKAGIKALSDNNKQNNDALRNDMKSLSREDKVSFREAINYNNSLHKQDKAAAKSEMDQLKLEIKKRREEIKAEKKKRKAEEKAKKEEQKKLKAEEKAKKEKQKKEDAEAKVRIKNQMDTERDETIKKVNKSVDNEMLNEAQRLADSIKKSRANGDSIDHKTLLSKLRALSGRAKKSKIKYKRRYTNEYKTKYKDELARYYKNR